MSDLQMTAAFVLAIAVLIAALRVVWRWDAQERDTQRRHAERRAHPAGKGLTEPWPCACGKGPDRLPGSHSEHQCDVGGDWGRWVA